MYAAGDAALEDGSYEADKTKEAAILGTVIGEKIVGHEGE